jgi:hypothetical protein
VSRAALLGATLVAVAVGSVVLYKATGAMKSIAAAQGSGTMGPKARWIPVEGLAPWAQALADTANYFSWIIIALLFGVVIGALVKAALPARWLARVTRSSGPWGILLGTLVGAPLMLCACCITPVFDGAYERTRRLGPALALMLASPGLNPADLAITVLVFPPEIALARIVLSAVAVLGISAFLSEAQVAPGAPAACPVDEPDPTWGAFLKSLGSSLLDTSRRSLPVMVAGVFLSVVLAQVVPFTELSKAGGAVVAVLLVAAVATLVALPTFGEIPLGLALMLAGAPAGAVVAVLVAGPIINLPSLLVLRRIVSARVAAITGGAVFLVSSLGGLIASGLL